jgi:hypothetical protein
MDYPGLIIVQFKNRIYDLTNFNHPGGNHILQAVNFKEVSRYLIGINGLESTGSKAWVHS